jgi:transcriptional regulator NrdR family protein
LQRRNNKVWRRRECLKCGAVFTTEESAQYGLAWTVQPNEGALEPFSRDKLLLSIFKSCEHRLTALNDAGNLTETVIRRLISQVENGRLWSGSITQVTLVVLARFDHAAGVYYQSRHK